jgi:2-polyprenyl-6-methoxyphenol hydroxylase-like FAD-dependent oxidoreductase
VVVFEQAESFAEVGAGVQIGPNGVRALQRLGAWQAWIPARSNRAASSSGMH